MLESVAGYRVIRRLGEGARSTVLLAHAEHGDDRAVALKIFRAGQDEGSILVELEALDRARGEHVVGLLDVASDASGMPVPVLQRIAGGSLHRLLQQRDGLDTGEAITILAPLALAVARLHDRGVLHGALRTDAVLFDASGAPVLTGFGRARLVAPEAPPAAREAEPGFAADIDAFGLLARAVLERVDLDPRRGTGELLLDRPESLEAFASRLFELGDPMPVRFDVPLAEPQVPSRLVRQDPIPELPAAAVAIGVPEWLSAYVPTDLRDRAVGALASLRAVRRPVWIAGAAVAAALLVALVVVPSGSQSQAVSAPTPSPSPTAVAAGPVVGDDPVAAAVALLETRERCIRDLSVLCLDAVGQLGSVALADDQALVRAIQDGGETSELPGIDPDAMTLVERLGDTAIIGLGAQTQPASLLLMRSEAGWRIREYLN